MITYGKKNCGALVAVVITTEQLHSAKPEFKVQAQILLAACRRFGLVRISDNGFGWK